MAFYGVTFLQPAILQYLDWGVIQVTLSTRSHHSYFIENHIVVYDCPVFVQWISSFCRLLLSLFLKGSSTLGLQYRHVVKNEINTNYSGARFTADDRRMVFFRQAHTAFRAGTLTNHHGWPTAFDGGGRR